MRVVKGLLLAPALKLLNRLLKHDGNSVIIGGPLGWSWEDTIDDAHHGSLGSSLHADSHDRQHDHSLIADGSPIAVDGVPNLPASKITSGRFGMPRMPDGTSGYFLKAQGAGVDPVFAALLAADIPNLDAAKITSGTFPVGRGGTGLSTIALGGILYASALDTLSRLAPTAANQVLRATAADALQFAALLAADIPNLDAAKITSGTFTVPRGGTGLSTIALGGILYASALDTLSRIAPTAANQVLRSTAANALQIAALVAADIPSLDVAKITSGIFAVARGGTGLGTIAAGGILYASALDTLSRVAPSAANQVLRSTAANALQIAALVEGDIPNYMSKDKLAWNLNKRLKGAGAGVTPTEFDDVISITFIINGGGSAITTGQKGHLEIPFACTITGWTILADQSGSIVVDVWKDTYANFPPTVADTITGTEKPTLASVQKNQDLSLTTWTTAVAAGDILAFNVDSVATVTRVTLSIRATKT